MTFEEYFSWEQTDFAMARNRDPDWRLGQAFYIQHDHTGEPFPELFHERNDDKAREIIFECYING